MLSPILVVGGWVIPESPPQITIRLNTELELTGAANKVACNYQHLMLVPHSQSHVILGTSQGRPYTKIRSIVLMVYLQYSYLLGHVQAATVKTCHPISVE